MSYQKNAPSGKELKEIFKKAKKVFFVGIGGISMSSLAEYCVYLGKEVYGYDRERNDACKKLEGVVKKIKYCSTPDSASHMDLVVYTSAVGFDNFEIQCALKEGLPLVTRAELLGCVMEDYESRIGVSGMHGKSTVTSLIAHIYEYANLNPTVFCGAVMKEYLSPYKFGGTRNFIFEACEYKDAFLKFCPTDAIILNIDRDHPDFFKSDEQIISSFQAYGDKAKRVFINADDKMSSSLDIRSAITFAIGSYADYVARDIRHNEGAEFTVYRKGSPIIRCGIRQCGIHMIYNALCAFAVAFENGIPEKVIRDAIYSFDGSERRLEFYKKVRGGGSVFLDYAHHPAEISATLSALSEMGFKNIMCVFQPHTYSRTYALYKEFAECFGDTSRVILTDIYPAREENLYGISERTLAADIGADYIPSLEKIADEIKICKNDAIVIMGAGDIIKIKKFI